jgi:tetrahydromethanopterin S-methyltransferase subunit G
MESRRTNTMSELSSYFVQMTDAILGIQQTNRDLSNTMSEIHKAIDLLTRQGNTTEKGVERLDKKVDFSLNTTKQFLSVTKELLPKIQDDTDDFESVAKKLEELEKKINKFLEDVDKSA